MKCIVEPEDTIEIYGRFDERGAGITIYSGKNECSVLLNEKKTRKLIKKLEKTLE